MPQLDRDKPIPQCPRVCVHCGGSDWLHGDPKPHCWMLDQYDLATLQNLDDLTDLEAELLAAIEARDNGDDGIQVWSCRHCNSWIEYRCQDNGEECGDEGWPNPEPALLPAQ